MKRLIKILLTVSLIVAVFTSCEGETSYDKGYKTGYEEGYDIGVTEGWESGEEFTQRDIATMYEDFIDSPKMEEAAAKLWCYADENSGEDISEEDLREAIREFLKYYDAVEDFYHYIKTEDLFDVMGKYY